MRNVAAMTALTVFALVLSATQFAAQAAGCSKVGPSDKISINGVSQAKLARIGITRDLIFRALQDVSIPETSGCWAGTTGNFDGQIISAGVLQWNYGQGSLQPVLIAFRNQFATAGAYKDELARLMPIYGNLIFSSGCLRRDITDDCKSQILGLQDSGGRLQLPLKSEFDALFESDAMLQVQTDRFVRLLESVSDDLQRLFPKQLASVRQIKWAIDTKVQQGGFPGDKDIARARAEWRDLDSQGRQSKLHSLIRWYEGLSNAPDQAGASRVVDNVRVWNEKISSNQLTDEQLDLLQLTFLKSRTAQGESGRWQALTFQRRATIIFAAGCVAGNCVGI